MDLINELLGDTVMMLSGEHATLNWHWEDRNLPKLSHSSSEWNTTAAKIVNELAAILRNSDNKKRQIEPVVGNAVADDQSSGPL